MKKESPEMVWYSPDYDQLYVARKTDGFLFKDKYGEFLLMYGTLDGIFKAWPCYLIGEL